ncbi:hypothetical protein GFS31_05460 [Leptolyngbya sp. BL0902]|nr:hypothetical protein GFS31_05460 [Leptolyngbya sp. BL0902]
MAAGSDPNPIGSTPELWPLSQPRGEIPGFFPIPDSKLSRLTTDLWDLRRLGGLPHRGIHTRGDLSEANQNG